MNTLITIREMRYLPEAENQLREYILKHCDEVIGMSIYELAAKAYVSTATVIRFSRKVGCTGYSDMKLKIAAELRAFSDIKLNILDSTTISENDSPSSIIDKITNISLKSIEETRSLLDEKVLLKIANKVNDANVIDFYGMGASNSIAFDAAYKFMRIGKNVACFAVSDRAYVQAVNAGKDHFALIISYSGKTAEIVRIASILQKNGVETVSITSNMKNPLLSLTDYHLFVSAKETVLRSGAMASRTSTLYVLDLIYSLCISLNWKEANEKIVQTRIVTK